MIPTALVGARLFGAALVEDGKLGEGYGSGEQPVAGRPVALEMGHRSKIDAVEFCAGLP